MKIGNHIGKRAKFINKEGYFFWNNNWRRFKLVRIRWKIGHDANPYFNKHPYKEEFGTIGNYNFAKHFVEWKQDFFDMDAELLDKEVVTFTVEDEEGNPFYPKTLTIVFK